MDAKPSPILYVCSTVHTEYSTLCRLAIESSKVLGTYGVCGTVLVSNYPGITTRSETSVRGSYARSASCSIDGVLLITVCSLYSVVVISVLRMYIVCMEYGTTLS